MASGGGNIQHTEINNIILEKFGSLQNFYSSDWWRKIKTIPMYSEFNNVNDIFLSKGELTEIMGLPKQLIK